MRDSDKRRVKVVEKRSVIRGNRTTDVKFELILKAFRDAETAGVPLAQTRLGRKAELRLSRQSINRSVKKIRDSRVQGFGQG